MLQITILNVFNLPKMQIPSEIKQPVANSAK